MNPPFWQIWEWSRVRLSTAAILWKVGDPEPVSKPDEVAVVFFAFDGKAISCQRDCGEDCSAPFSPVVLERPLVLLRFEPFVKPVRLPFLSLPPRFLELVPGLETSRGLGHIRTLKFLLQRGCERARVSVVNLRF